MKTTAVIPRLERMFYRGSVYLVTVRKLVWGVGSCPWGSFSHCLNPALMQASSFAAALSYLPMQWNYCILGRKLKFLQITAKSQYECGLWLLCMGSQPLVLCASVKALTEVISSTNLVLEIRTIVPSSPQWPLAQLICDVLEPECELHESCKISVRFPLPLGRLA